MRHVETLVEIEAPISIVYDQWLHCEDFPRFMKAVECVDELPSGRIYWSVQLLGYSVEWEAEVTSLIPRQEIAWRSVVGHPHEGVVTFSAVAPDVTRVMVVVDYQPLGIIEEIGDALGAVEYLISQGLRNIKEFMETQGRLQIADVR